MSFTSILCEPAIIIITLCFILFLITLTKNYSAVKNNLNSVENFLATLDKKELSYRFQQLNDFMLQNNFTATNWENFKKALIFPEKLFTTSAGISDKNYKPEVYLTADVSCFFNEETLITSKINYRYIQILPTILTGLGPFFTFMKIAIAFTTVNLAVEQNIAESLSGLMSNIQIAALCSVFAVGYSLLFMVIEKIIYNRNCKKHYLAVQKELVRLFDVVAGEQLLLDIVKEAKILNMNNNKLVNTLPEAFSDAIAKSIGEKTIPYLENILYGLNKINETLNKGSNGDVVDNLF